MIVDWQTHWFPKASLDWLIANGSGYPRVERSDGGRYLIESAPGRFMSFEGYLRPEFVDFDLQLQAAAENGIDVLVSSLDGFGEAWDLEPAAAAEWLDLVHEELAANERRHPGRFRGLAMLPMHHPETAVEVLDRAVTQHGLRGVVVLATINGAPIATDELLPVYQRMGEHGVPMWIHPSPRSNTSEQFMGKRVEGGLGWMFHTSAAALALIDNGILDRCPGLTIVHPHLGGMLPYVAGRLNRIGSDVELSLDEYLRTRFFTDTVSLTPGALQMAIDTYGRDRVLYATDFPFENLPRLCAFIAETAGDDYEAIRSNVIPGFLD